jgi:Lipid A 3-O-deacylase (PagL)
LSATRLLAGILTLALGGLLPAIACAQGAETPGPRFGWSLGPYFGISRHSPVGSHWGVTPDRHHVLVGIHATVTILERQRWALSYAPELVPLVVVTNNPTYRMARAATGQPLAIVEDGASPVTGVAFAPIGLETRVALTSRWRAYGAGALGGVWFTRQVPIFEARAFNFTFEFGGGLQFRLGARTWLRAGYKFHHLSNAQTAPANPGVDAKVFLIGFDRTFGG